jgi:uracil-DNA glycosylase
MSALGGLVERGLVAADWAEALAPVDAVIARMGQFLRDELAAGRSYLPHGDHVLRAFRRPLADVRVLVVGQDPYPTPGHAVGLSFSVAPDVRPVPRSLINIFTELESDLGMPRPSSGDLTPWADQGVLLLNRVLTVRPGEAWGRDAQGLKSTLGPVPWVESPHPSPLSASRGFFGSRPFSRVNDLLARQGADPVDWRLP